jgi:hypothetical protein
MCSSRESFPVDGVPMDSLNALGVFMRAAEARSFTGAGRQLSISSSAVGKAIFRLEDRLGVRLFHRDDGRVSLDVRFLKHPQVGVYLELFTYHHPKGDQTIHRRKTNDLTVSLSPLGRSARDIFSRDIQSVGLCCIGR